MGSLNSFLHKVSRHYRHYGSFFSKVVCISSTFIELWWNLLSCPFHYPCLPVPCPIIVTILINPPCLPHRIYQLFFLHAFPIFQWLLHSHFISPLFKLSIIIIIYMTHNFITLAPLLVSLTILLTFIRFHSISQTLSTIIFVKESEIGQRSHEIIKYPTNLPAPLQVQKSCQRVLTNILKPFSNYHYYH